jgi:hypothetical protein
MDFCIIFSGRVSCYNDELSPKHLVKTLNASTFCSINHNVDSDFIELYNVVVCDVKPYVLQSHIDVSLQKKLRTLIVPNNPFNPNRDNMFSMFSMYYHHLNNSKNIPIDAKHILLLRTDIITSNSEYKKLSNMIQNTKFENDTIYIPNGGEFGGGMKDVINDQIALGNYVSMMKYLSIYNKLVELIYGMRRNNINAELVLREHLIKCKIKIIYFDFNYKLNPRRWD